MNNPLSKICTVLDFSAPAFGAFTIAAVLLAAPARPLADPAASDEPADFQAFVGVLQLDDQRGQWEEISDGDVEVDFSNLITGGLEAEYVFYEGWVHLGLNPGGSLAFKSDDTRFSGGVTNETGGFLQVALDNTVFLAELHLGAYVRGRLHERITAYAAAGPMVLYGYHEVDDESVEGSEESLDLSENDSSAFNIGYYGRAGIDFEFRPDQHFGLGVRYLNSELDFDQTVGNIDIEGPQYVLTFTRRL
ncbi:MAG: hypothetical protein U5K56_11590 [Halioglobus sp.]|nr:hypothetical protein [Halioglobus sp.]